MKEKLIKNFITIFWGFLTIIITIPYIYYVNTSKELTLLWIFLINLIIFFWISFAIRIFWFRNNLKTFIRHILAGNYNSGIKLPWIKDEIYELCRNINDMAHQLSVYDELRINRITTLSKIVHFMHINTSESLIIIDKKKKSFF